jgi:hypothetical protein
MSSTLTSLESKHNALRERRNADKAVQMEIDKLVKVHVDGEEPVPSGCFPRLAGCAARWTPFRSRRMAVSTVDVSEATSSTTHVARNARGDVMLRFVGRSKQAQEHSENVRIEQAMDSVSLRVEGLSDRLKVMRAQAIASSKAGKREEAIRELKKSKGVEKQLATANAALEALERQADALAQTALQKELASALASANSQMKTKSKGLLSMAEKAVDESTEHLDESEDIAQVFEGLVPIGGGVDDEELLDELNALVGEEETMDEPQIAEQTNDSLEEWNNFPAAPSSNVSKRGEDRQSLLSSQGAV